MRNSDTPVQLTARTLRPGRARTWIALALASLIAACATSPAPKPVEPPPPPMPAPAPVVPAPEPEAQPHAANVSNAPTARDYRRDAAAHLYSKNEGRIYAGKMPALLYAVGVLQVDIDSGGNVLAVRWMRAPTQAPEVMAYIEQYTTIRDFRSSMYQSLTSVHNENAYMQMDKQTIEIGKFHYRSSLITPTVPLWLSNAVKDTSTYLNVSCSDFVNVLWCIGVRKSMCNENIPSRILEEVKDTINKFDSELDAATKRIEHLQNEVS